MKLAPSNPGGVEGADKFEGGGEDGDDGFDDGFDGRVLFLRDCRARKRRIQLNSAQSGSGGGKKRRRRQSAELEDSD